jgi:hypothetical protein
VSRQPTRDGWIWRYFRRRCTHAPELAWWVDFRFRRWGCGGGDGGDGGDGVRVVVWDRLVYASCSVEMAP